MKIDIKTNPNDSNENPIWRPFACTGELWLKLLNGEKVYIFYICVVHIRIVCTKPMQRYQLRPNNPVNSRDKLWVRVIYTLYMCF